MKIFKNKILRNTFITFFTAIITTIIVYGGYTIFAEVEYLGQFSDTQYEYHSSMNQYFNEKLERMVDIMEEEEGDFFKHKDFQAPEGRDCDETNVSTFCVAMGALDMYIEYVEELNRLRGLLPVVQGEIATSEEALRSLDAREEEVRREVDEAKLVMEATLSAYDAFRSAYPMHIKLEEITNNLIKYKIALGKIRKQTAKFPIKFVDSTSSKCE